MPRRKKAAGGAQATAERSPYVLAFESLAENGRWHSGTRSTRYRALLQSLRAAEDPRLHEVTFSENPFSDSVAQYVTRPFDTVKVGAEGEHHTLNWAFFWTEHGEPPNLAKILVTPPDGHLPQTTTGIYIAHHRASDTAVPFEVGPGPDFPVLTLGEVAAKNTLELLLQANQVLRGA